MSMSMLQRSAWLAWLILALSAAGLIVLMGDSKPPFRMISATTNTPRAGEVLRADVVVVRDLSRRCSVTFSQHIFDSSSTRVDMLPLTFMPAAGLDQLDAESPGHLRLAIPLPDYIKPGPAKLVTPLAYVCHAWHSVRPIEVLMTVEFEVAP